MPIVQEHMFAVSAAVDNIPIPGLFDGFDGFEVSTSSETFAAGGMADAEALPGPVTTGEGNISRAYRGERDAPLEKWLMTRMNHPIVIGRQTLNPDKSPVPGGQLTIRGIVTGVTPVTHDSNGTAVTRLQITVLAHGIPT